MESWLRPLSVRCTRGFSRLEMQRSFARTSSAHSTLAKVVQSISRNSCWQLMSPHLGQCIYPSGTPRGKLLWAFRMYDVDGNGVIDQDGMTKIVQQVNVRIWGCTSKPTIAQTWYPSPVSLVERLPGPEMVCGSTEEKKTWLWTLKMTKDCKFVAQDMIDIVYKIFLCQVLRLFETIWCPSWDLLILIILMFYWGN